MDDKKKLTLCFNRKIQKQKLALDVLMYEHDRTGLPFMYIIHEALVVYAKSRGYINRHGEPEWKMEAATVTGADPDGMKKNQEAGKEVLKSVESADSGHCKDTAVESTGTGHCTEGVVDSTDTGYCSPDMGTYATDNYSDLINA